MLSRKASIFLFLAEMVFRTWDCAAGVIYHNRAGIADCQDNLLLPLRRVPQLDHGHFAGGLGFDSLRRQMEEQMNQTVKRFEIPIVAGLFIWGAVFLFRMAYLRIWVSTPICVLYLLAIYAYVKARYEVKIPIILLFLIWVSVALDGLGNLFNLYNTKFKYFQYDEFTHTAVPALTAPVIVWLLRMGLEHFGYRLPLGLVTFFAVTTMFTLSGFYEIVELWDDKYMWPQPGMRIHGSYDTPNDLQCGLLGMTIGGVLAYAILKRQVREPIQAEGIA
jgi:uncharacterized membrane protein YjdF